MKQIFFLLAVAFLLVSCKDMKTCPVCGGEGKIKTMDVGIIQCSGCQGKGEVPAKNYEAIKNIWSNIVSNQQGNPNVGGNQQERQTQCPMCSGTGIFSAYGNSQTCSECKGSGYTTVSRAAQLQQSLQQIDQITGGGGYGETSINDGTYRQSDNNNQKSEPDRSCHYCHGTGHCQQCKGIGLVDYEDSYSLDRGVMTCPICKGTKKCNLCYGTGHI